MRPRLKTGDLGNGFLIDPLDPLGVEDIIIRRGNGFFVHFSNLKGVGMSNFRVNKLRISSDPFKVDFILEVQKMEAFGTYKLDMALGIINLKGNGKVKAIIGEKT